MRALGAGRRLLGWRDSCLPWYARFEAQIVMRGFARRGARSRALVAVVLGGLLSFTSTRCMSIVEAGCPLVGSAQASGGSLQGHDHEAPGGRLDHARHGDDVSGHDHGSRGDNTPGHTCCELTGKYAFAASGSPVPPLVPTLVIVALVVGGEGCRRASANFIKRQPVPLLHHPPPYLRFASLLI